MRWPPAFILVRILAQRSKHGPMKERRAGLAARIGVRLACVGIGASHGQVWYGDFPFPCGPVAEWAKE